MPSKTIYDIRHVTIYEYRSPVPFARCVLRLALIDRPGQVVTDSTLDLDPPPEERHDDVDCFGNRISRIAFNAPHARLTIRATARVEVSAGVNPATRPDSPAWESLRDEALALRDLSGASPIHFLFASRYVPLNDQVMAYVARSFTPGRPVAAAALDLTSRIRRDFTYDPNATSISTPLAEAFTRRRGVCQDFAHVMISGLRSLGIPAAYVSGYLRTVPPPGQARLEGADAMHAWVAIWGGSEIGWMGLDPTNGIPAGESHVVVAIGRDYADVSPVDGFVRTSGDQGMRVAVDVIEVPPPRPAASEGAAPAAPAAVHSGPAQASRPASASIKPA